jgi:gliding motility-associated-like protein
LIVFFKSVTMNRLLCYLLCTLLFVSPIALHAQACTTLGQTPATAFPVCGTSVFTQSNVPSCTNAPNLFVPGCDPNLCAYSDVNPFYYRFKCYQSGTLGFTITPLSATDDYDWQLYDITGLNPNEIFTNRNIIVTGNWAGNPGPTGASATGANFIQCCSQPTGTEPRFSAMPILQVDHEYILLVSNYSPSQVGYQLSFNGGTAVITDPLLPKLNTAKPDCDGRKITVKLNKYIRCNSATLSGSEFSLLPAVTTVIAAQPDSCSFGFDVDEITLSLAAPLTNGTYELVINNGSDNNTLLDDCARAITQGEKVTFTYFIPQPIFADSVGRTPCAPDSVKLYFPKRILCSTIDPRGIDFTVTGPSVVNVVSATGNCINDKTDFVTVKFATPIKIGGTYRLRLLAGTDTVIIQDECGQALPTQNMNFTVADTVTARFNFSATMGCQQNNYLFSHNGAGGINSFNWTFNNTVRINTQTHRINFPANSTNTISLRVSNGTCTDSISQQLVLNNQVKASFTLSDSIICPEDKLTFVNTSLGQVDQWRWQFDAIGTSNLKDPAPFQFPFNNRESYYRIRLRATNLPMACSDSAEKIVRVLNHCLIEVPNAFTPNNDGLNDWFSPHNALKANKYSFTVYNRWGQLVYQTNNWMDRWDGKVKGQIQPTGVYVWKLSYTHRDTGQPIFRKGTVTLIR